MAGENHFILKFTEQEIVDLRTALRTLISTLGIVGISRTSSIYEELSENIQAQLYKAVREKRNNDNQL